MIENKAITYKNIKKWFKYNPETGDIKHTMKWPGLRKGKAVMGSTYINGRRYARTLFAYILITKKVPNIMPRIRDTKEGLVWSNIFIPEEEIDHDMELMKSFLVKGFMVKPYPRVIQSY